MALWLRAHCARPDGAAIEGGMRGDGPSGTGKKEKTEKTVRGRSWVWIHLTFFRYPEETLGWKAVAEVGLAAVHSVHP